MRPWHRACVVLVAVAALAVLDRARLRESEGDGPTPSDWFGLQRAFPGETIPQERYRAAMEQARFDRALAESGDRAGAHSALAGVIWSEAGPFNIGGRVTALAAVPGGATVYLGAAAGGVFKSTDAGDHWTPVFDQQGVFSIGALALDPADSSTCYVGTGESNGAIDNYDGAGVFRTRDGAASWQFLGLAETARIAAVRVDPLNPDRIFVAAMGTQFSTGPHRGLYRSEDGGANWTQVLFVNDSTGACDIAINPAHPETVYCATWERVRRLTYRRVYGPGCGIWRSVDSGTTWTRLAGGLPAPSDNVGRIGLALAPSLPSTVYAQIITGASGGYRGLGYYRTTDGGDSWVRRDTGTLYADSFGGFGWYFGATAVDPTNPDIVFAMGLDLLRSTDGGTTFATWTGAAHVDQHAIWIDPTDPLRVYLGNDGGFFSSTSGGSAWQKSLDLPITQFYAGTVDPSNTSRLLGGTQDNFTLMTTGSAQSWSPILGGDGFYCLVDPTDPSVMFAEWQNCCGRTGPRRSTNGGAGWSQPSGIVTSDRFNWNTPFVMDPSNHQILLLGSQRVYKSTDNGASYAPISGDLTTNPPSLLNYGTITTLAISPVDPTLYYAGTDDGRVWHSVNAGSNWTEISGGLPRRWVTRVTADPFDSGVVYVTLSGFGWDEHLPHVFRSANRGGTWSSISGNLPDAPANDILVDTDDSQVLYLATDVGVYATLNQGAMWFPLGSGMPVQTVFDLTFHAPTRTLVAATHGRSQWRLSLEVLPVSTPSRPVPARLALAVPVPNPSRGRTQLVLEVSRASSVEVTIYDATGRRVRGLLRGPIEPGRHALAWDGADDRGRSVGPGVYFARALGAGASATRRVVRAD